MKPRLTVVVQKWQPPLDHPPAPMPDPANMTPAEVEEYVLSRVEQEALDVGMSADEARQLRSECENDPIKAMRVLGQVPRDFRL